MKPKGTHHDITNDFGQPVTRPKSPVDFSSVASSSKTTNGNGVSNTPQVKEMPEFLSNSTADNVDVVVYPMEYFSSNSVSHHTYASVKQTSQSLDDSVIHNDGNLDDQPYISETNDRPDSTPITQPPPLTSKKSLERNIAILREKSVPGDFASDKPSTNVRSPPLNSTTTDNNFISPKDDAIDRKVEAKPKPSMIFIHFLIW